VTALADRLNRSPRGLEAVAFAAVAVVGLAVVGLSAAWPMQVLLGTLAFAAIVLCLVRVEVAVLVLVALAPLELAISLGAKSQLSPTKLAGLVCFTSFAFFAIATNRRLVLDRIQGVAVAILALAMLSTLAAEDQALAVSTTARYASFVALCFIVGQFVGNHRLERQIAWVLSIGSAITGVLALSSFFSGESSAARLPLGDPGDIGFILATTLPFTFWLARERGPTRAAAIGLIGVILVASILTLSRGTVVGLGAGLVWFLVSDPRRNFRVVLAGAAVALVALAGVIHFEGDRIEQGLEAKAKVAQANVDSRLAAWSAAARFSVDHPLLGIGPDNFRIHYPEYAEVPAGVATTSVVHNSFLDIAAELGPLAMLLFIAYIVLVFHRLTVAVRGQRGPPGFAVAARTSLVIGLAASLTLTEQYYAPFWLLGGLAVALARDEPASPTS
jgi:putative inorganic carbon (hco3(-)) transporter